MPDGPNEVTILNRLDTWAGVGVFCRKSGTVFRYGVIRGLPAGGSTTIGIPNDTIEVYWIRQDRPSSRFHSPKSFRVSGGNSRVQKTLTSTIGADEGDTPIEETF